MIYISKQQMCNIFTQSKICAGNNSLLLLYTTLK